MSTDTPPSDPDWDRFAGEIDRDAAARAAVYDLLARAMDEPSAELAEAMAAGEFEAELRALVEQTSLDVAVPTIATEDDHETLCARFNDLFRLGHAQYTDRTDGSLDASGPPVPLYESSYRDQVSWNDVNLDLARAYDYFGVEVDQTNRQHHDHARLELQFASYLCRREAAVDASAANARLDFHDRHLGVLASGMNAAIADEPGTDVYGPLLAFFEAFVDADVEDIDRRDEP
ncbi:molecular chaperone TorD family protein [Haloarculaceae archaeon H-GB2-1]|nr:molecular chaperone TorD family protein [Haloarculaceae archaeon H-GB1-1]MEA5386893.1 molecular chaperone TorD family protein [Haloarculaceae archaeon H-GB11]MEA5408372.1 molecular chaperone TorD family protein [Haloarculaceae archaeon H-GB2-1]